MPVCVQPTKKMKSKYCLFAGCESGKEKFGIINQLYEQPFASKEFSWTVLSEFKEVQFNLVNVWVYDGQTI